MFGGPNVQGNATLESLTGKADDGTLPTEGEPGQRLIAQVAQHLGLLQGNAQPDEHFEFASGHVLSGETGKSQVLAIELRDGEAIVVLELRAPRNFRELSRAMGELAETDRRIAQIRLVVGIEYPEPVRSNAAIEFYKVIHSASEADGLPRKKRQHFFYFGGDGYLGASGSAPSPVGPPTPFGGNY